MDKKLITKGSLTLFLFTLAICSSCVSFNGKIGGDNIFIPCEIEQNNSSPLGGYGENLLSSYNIRDFQSSQLDPSEVMERPSVGNARMLAIPVSFSDQGYTTLSFTIDSRWDNLTIVSLLKKTINSNYIFYPIYLKK